MLRPSRTSGRVANGDVCLDSTAPFRVNLCPEKLSATPSQLNARAFKKNPVKYSLKIAQLASEPPKYTRHARLTSEA